MKILLIEDSKLQRVANGRALVKAGYEVIHAADGEEGLRSARENIPDLILLLKEGATAFLMKSMESFENNSLALIQALQSLLTGSKAKTVRE
jgi:PleD family two-component response regulator